MKDLLISFIIAFYELFHKICFMIKDWIKRNIFIEEFQKVYAAYTFILMTFLFFSLKYNSNLIKFLNLVVLISAAIVLICIYKRILKMKEDHMKFYSQSLNWWLTVSFFWIFASMSFVHVNTYLVKIFLIPFSLFFYYGMRYLFLKWVKHWFFYFVLFSLMPILSFFIYSFLGSLIFEFTNKEFFVSDTVFKWMVILLCVLLTSIFVCWTPADRFDEVKVAVYLLLAFFSTISYCFFISDYLAEVVTSKLNEINQFESFTRDEIKELIDVVVKWVSLPYLIGSVFACFTLELIARNRNIREKSR